MSAYNVPELEKMVKEGRARRVTHVVHGYRVLGEDRDRPGRGKVKWRPSSGDAVYDGFIEVADPEGVPVTQAREYPEDKIARYFREVASDVAGFLSSGVVKSLSNLLSFGPELKIAKGVVEAFEEDSLLSQVDALIDRFGDTGLKALRSEVLELRDQVNDAIKDGKISGTEAVEIKTKLEELFG